MVDSCLSVDGSGIFTLGKPSKNKSSFSFTFTVTVGIFMTTNKKPAKICKNLSVELWSFTDKSLLKMSSKMFGYF